MSCRPYSSGRRRSVEQLVNQRVFEGISNELGGRLQLKLLDMRDEVTRPIPLGVPLVARDYSDDQQYIRQ